MVLLCRYFKIKSPSDQNTTLCGVDQVCHSVWRLTADNTMSRPTSAMAPQPDDLIVSDCQPMALFAGRNCSTDRCLAVLDASHWSKVADCCCSTSLCNDQPMHVFLSPSTSLSESSNNAVLIAVPIVVCFLLAICLVLSVCCYRRRRRKRYSSRRQSESIEMGPVETGSVQLDDGCTFEPICRLNGGGQGSVWKGMVKAVDQQVPMSADDEEDQLLNDGDDSGYGPAVLRRLKTGDSVAIKKMPFDKHDCWQVELRILRRIFQRSESHVVNIVRFLAARDMSLMTDEPHPFWIITELMDESLYDCLKRRQVSWIEAGQIMRGFISGLTFLHSDLQPPIAHRDFKSRNVLLKWQRSDGSVRAVVSDFGLALCCENDAQRPTLQVGTRRYMSPELLNGYVKMRSWDTFLQIDIYAAALVMWEVLYRCTDLYDDEVPAYSRPFDKELRQAFCQTDDGHTTTAPPCTPFAIYTTSNFTRNLTLSMATDALDCDNPTNEQMLKLVKEQNVRPEIAASWRQRGPAVRSLIDDIIIWCWDSTASARISASAIHSKLAELDFSAAPVVEDLDNAADSRETAPDSTEPATSPSAGQ